MENNRTLRSASPNDNLLIPNHHHSFNFAPNNTNLEMASVREENIQCALLTYVYVVFTTDPAYNRGGGYTPVVVAFAFLIGLPICSVFTTPLSSVYRHHLCSVCVDPELMRDHPDLYHRMI